MDKNTITGFVLIAAILILFSWWNKPSEEQLAQQRLQDSIENVARQKAETAKKTAELAAAQQKSEASQDSTALFHSALTGSEQQVVLKNEKVELTFSTKGATIEKAVVKNFEDRKDNPDLTLFDKQDQQLKFILEGKETNIVSSDLFFTPSEQTDSTVVFTADAAPGQQLTVKYLLGKDYMLHASIQATGMGGLFSPQKKEMAIEWHDKARQQEKGFTFENRYASLTWHETDGGTDYLNEGKSYEDEKVEDEIDWVAFKNQFFSAVIIAKDGFGKDNLMTSIPQEKGSGYLKEYNAKLKTFFDPEGKQATELEFYYGPNDFRLLKDVEKQSKFGKDLEMERLVYLGWPLFRIINRWFTLYVFDGLTKLNINMGIVLILITLLLKLITYPMVKKSYMSSAKMRVLKPKLEEATKQYDKPEDQMMKQQAMMAEYSKYGVSPLSGCLPMLIQMPIWIAMFNFVPNAIQLRRESFLYRRPPLADLHTLLRGQRALLVDVDASAERSDGGTAGRTDEDDAVDDVFHARDVLLHVQRLFVGPELLLLRLAVLLSSHHVDAPQDHQRRETAGHPGKTLQGEPKQSEEDRRHGRTPGADAETGGGNAKTPGTAG